MAGRPDEQAADQRLRPLRAAVVEVGQGLDKPSNYWSTDSRRLQPKTI